MNLIRRSIGALLQSKEYDQYTLRAGCTDTQVVCLGDTKYLYLNTDWNYASTTPSGNFRWAGTAAIPGDIVRTSPWGVGYELSTE